MKLGEYIENNDIAKVCVAIDGNDPNEFVRFADLDMIPVKYWNADVKTFRHKINWDNDTMKSIDIIAVLKI